jgi:hypothetical protein
MKYSYKEIQGQIYERERNWDLGIGIVIDNWGLVTTDPDF